MIHAVKTTLLEQYSSVRKQTEDLCSDLKTEDYVAQPAVFVSPPKWHLAHTTWFFEAFVLSVFDKKYTPFHPRYAYIFNSYYQHEGKRVQRDMRGHMTRPTVEQVYAYRAYVNEKMEELIDSMPEHTDLIERVVLGLNHEQQHQELLVYDIKYILGHNPLYPAVDIPIKRLLNGTKPAETVLLEAGIYEIGYRGTDFHFDNEVPAHEALLPQGEIQADLVRNVDMLAFIEAGGYQDFKYWLDEGWNWVQQHEIQAPEYWFRQDAGRWLHYQLTNGLVDLDEDAPLMHISFYEADALARFMGKDLPTEFEWEAASDGFEWGQLWEWTASAYRPYPGFCAAEGALGEYNGKFMVNQMVLKGASIATPEGHSRPTYRNFFHPYERWMFSGLRLKS